MNRAIDEGMAVFDAAGEPLGRVEALTGPHFVVTQGKIITERIVVDVEDAVDAVDDEGVHLRFDRETLLERNALSLEEHSHAEVSGAAGPQVERGDEERSDPGPPAPVQP
jgi:hypothetical protein